LARVIKLGKPSLRVTYEVEELSSPGLVEMLVKFSQEHRLVPAGVGR
jgi:hypothetical protein